MAQSYPTPDQKKLSQIDADSDIHQFRDLVHHNDDDDDLYHFEKAIAVKRLLEEKQLQAWVTVQAGIQTPVCEQVTGAYITDNCGTILVEKTGLDNIALTEIDLCAIFNELELVALTGRVALGKDPFISTSYSVDGLAWSQDRQIRVGGIGNTRKRLVWLQQGHMRHWRIQRFRGTSDAHLSFMRLEAQIEALAH